MKVIETQYVQIFLSLSNMALQVIQQLHLGSLTLSLQIGTLAYPSCALKLFHTQGQMEAHQVFLGPIRRHLQWCITIAKASHESHENLQFVWASRSRTTGSSTGGASKKPTGHLQQILDDHRNSWSEGLWDLPYLWSRWTWIWNLHPSKLCTSKGHHALKAALRWSRVFPPECKCTKVTQAFYIFLPTRLKASASAISVLGGPNGK